MKILVFSRDPGGANGVIPLVKPLQLRGHVVKLWGKDNALLRYESAGLSGMDITEHLSGDKHVSLETFLRHEKFDVVITATSADDDTEKLLWLCGDRIGIPSVAIVDQWMNLGIRFSKFDTRTIADYEKSPDVSAVPTKICLVDETVAEDAVRIGLPAGRLCVTGHPHLDSLKERSRKIPPERIAAIGADFVSAGEPLIVFASEVLTETYADPVAHWGFSELTILASIRRALASLTSTIVVRAHPKEDLSKLERAIGQTSGCRCRIERSVDSLELMSAADVVCGMSSMFLVEAAMLGRPVVSVQIGRTREDPFALTRFGVLKAVMSEDRILPAVRSAISEGPKAYTRFRVVQQAVDNVIREVERLVQTADGS